MASEHDERPAPPERTCRCGFKKGDFWVRPSHTFGFWGTLAQIFGVTARPIRVDYECGRCRQRIESITDPAALAAFRPGRR